MMASIACIPPRVWWFVAAHALVLLGFCGSLIVGEHFSAYSPEYGETGILQPADVVGIVLAMVAIVAAPIAAGMAIITTAGTSKWSRVMISLYFAIAGVIIATAAMVFSIRPGDTFNLQNSPDNVQQLLGGMVFALAVPFTLTAAYITMVHTGGGNAAQVKSVLWLKAALGEVFIGRNARLVVGGVVCFAVAAFLSSILSCVMNFGPGE